MPNNYYFQILVQESTLMSPLDFKEIKSVNTKGNLTTLNSHGRTDAEIEAPIFWQPNTKRQFTGKYSDSGNDWRQKKWVAEDEMVGYHHQLNESKFDKALGNSEGQGSLPCCSSWDLKQSDTN